MKYKITLIIIIGIILTTLIYIYTKNDKITFLALGDGISTGMTPYHVEGYDFNDFLTEDLNSRNVLKKYYKNFNEVDETIKSLLEKIDKNEPIINNNLVIKQAIKKSDIITISLGMDELNNYASKNLLTNIKINSFINNYGLLIDKIKKINSGRIFVIGLYKSKLINDSKIELINQKLRELCLNKEIEFIDISNIVNYNEYFNVKNNYYPNYKGQKYIYNQILSKIEYNAMSII